MITGIESGNKERTMDYCEEGIFEGCHLRSPSIDMDLVCAISPLNAPPMDTSETLLHNSAKVQGLSNMEEKSMVIDAEKLESGVRKRFPTVKGKQYQVQRLKDRRTMALRHVARQIKN